MDNKQEAFELATKRYGDIYLVDGWIENEWHIMKLPEVWQGNILQMDGKWFFEIPHLEGDIVVASDFVEVK